MEVEHCIPGDANKIRKIFFEKLDGKQMMA